MTDNSSHLSFTAQTNSALTLLSVLWHCWLGVRKSIRLVKNLSDEVLVRLSVWSEVQMICIWFSWCHCHPIISCFIKISNGSAFLVPAYPGWPGKEAVKWVISIDTHTDSQTYRLNWSSYHATVATVFKQSITLIIPKKIIKLIIPKTMNYTDVDNIPTFADLFTDFNQFLLSHRTICLTR